MTDPEGKRRQGRPRLRLNDGLVEDAKIYKRPGGMEEQTGEVEARL